MSTTADQRRKAEQQIIQAATYSDLLDAVDASYGVLDEQRLLGALESRESAERELVTQIEMLCRRYATPAVNTGAHALALEIVRKIERVRDK